MSKLTKGTHLRWHRYHIETDVKQIKKFPIDIEANKLSVEPGYTEWRRGCGPLPEASYNRLLTRVKETLVGVPKSETQKEKMRLAKLGKPKSEEHKRNMAIAQQRRWSKIKNA